MKNLMRVLSILLLIIALSFQVSGQQRNLENEVLVYIQPGYFEFPDGPTNQLKIEDIKTISNNISKVIKEKNVVLFSKAFPEFKSSDTISFNSDGYEIKLADVSRIFIFSLNEKSNKQSLIDELSKTEGILFAEGHSNWQTYDIRYPEQWWLNNTGQYGGTVDADIDAPEAWQITQGSETVKVGIIDSGVEITHSDLSGKSIGDLPESYYSYGHGTHVAGIVGAKNNEGEVKGVSPNTSIVSRKVFSGVDSYGRALWAGDNNAYSKIMEAINEGCSILNHSYGGPNYSTTLRIAFANITKFNRSSTVAMGNSNSSSLSYPAAFGQGIIAVGSTDNLDIRSQDNTPGYEWGSNYGNHIDITAPGGKYAFVNDKNILSTWTGNSYLKISGTSMASPVVAGIASLLKAYNPNLYNDDIEQIIRLSVDDKGPVGWDQEYGTGRVNAYNALNLLRAPYQLSQLSAYGGTDYFKGPAFYIDIYGASGLQDGRYIAYRHEVRRNVSFSNTTNPWVWGRGVGTVGWSAANPNFTMGYCNAVTGTVTNTSATLYTYVYEVYTTLGQWKGWYPSTPQNVNFNYTVLGKPALLTATMSGPSYLASGQSGTFVVTASGGTPPYSYAWSYYVYCNEPAANPNSNGDDIIEPNAVPCGYWFNISNTTNTVTRMSDGKSFQMKCIVRDANNSTVTVTKNVGGSLSKSMAMDSANTITNEIKTELLNNFPNPFNPSTKISYSLQNEGRVSLKIYNTLGEEVITLVDEMKPAGNYESEFNASELPSGIYIYRMQSNEYVSSKKMLLIK